MFLCYEKSQLITLSVRVKEGDILLHQSGYPGIVVYIFISYILQRIKIKLMYCR